MNDSDLADLIPSSNSDSMTTLKVPVVTIQNQHRTPKKSSFMPSKPSPLANPETSLVKKASSPHAVEAQEKMKRLVCANQRTEDEAKVLFNKIQHFPFFETFNDRNSSSFFGDEAFIRLCQTARYEKHAAKKVIFKEGDPTNGKLYIIYSGEVSVVNQPPGGPFITQDPALQTPDDLKDNMSEDNDSSVFTYNGRDDIRFSRFSAERRSTGSFLFTARDSKIKIVDSDGEFCPSPGPPKISRRNTRMISMDILNQMKKQSSEPFTEDGDDSAKLDKRFKNLELRQSVFSNNASRDSLRWNPNNPNSARELKHRMSGIVEPENSSRRGSWKILQHVIPNLAKFKHAVSKKQEAIPLKDVIKQYGNTTNTLGVGEFFGERAVFEQSTRASTIVTNTECEFLVIYKRDFYYVSRNYDRKRTKLLDFIFNFTPDIENIHTFQIAEDLLSILKERTFEKGSHIIEEGKHGNHIVMLFEGSCELVKTLKIDERPDKKDFLAPMQQLVRVRPVYSEELLVCNLDRGAFLGEEILFTEQKSYSFSGRVTSAFATVFMVSKQDFHMRFTKLTQNHIKNLFFAKRKKHGTLMKYLLQTKYPTLEVCPPPDASPENSPDYDVKVISHPIHLRPKDRAEGKRKQRVGLFNALIEQGEDATVLNQYMTTSPAELGHGHGHPKLKRESSLKLAKNATVEKPKKTPQTVVLELDKGHSETNLDLAPKTLLSQGQKGINRNINTPSPTFKTRKVTPREMVAAMPPATTRTKLQVRDLKVETSMEHPDHLIDYIKSSQTLTLRSVATVGDVAGSKVNLETVRSGDLNMNNGDKNTERMRLKSAGQSRLERRLMSEAEKNDDGPPLDLLSDIFESNKKAKKILEIQKSRISPRIRSVTASSMVDTRLSPMMKTENFYENMKDRYQGKVKNSARLMSARQNTGPFLMINMSPIEPAQSCRSSPKKQIALSAVASAMTSPITRKTSSKTPYSFTPAAQEVTDKDEDLDDKDFRRPIMRDTFTSMLRTERPMTSKSVSKGGAGKIMKALYASTEDVLSKAKTDPSTRILKMKYKRNMKLKMKRQSEKIEIGTNKESVVIDYQVNGALHTYSGQKMFTRTKQQRPMSGVNFGKVVL